jgi:hypothetical protein
MLYSLSLLLPKAIILDVTWSVTSFKTDYETLNLVGNDAGCCVLMLVLTSTSHRTIVLGKLSCSKK